MIRRYLIGRALREIGRFLVFIVPLLLVDPQLLRLRAVWRLVAHSLLLVGFGFVSLVLIQSASAESPFWLQMLVFAVAAVLPATWVSARAIDRRSFASLGFHLDRRWWMDLGFGLALGAVLMAAIFVVELSAGWLTIVDTRVVPKGFAGPFALAMVPPAILFIAVGFYEELMSRGYHLRNVAEGSLWPGKIGPAGALVIGTLVSATVFGLFHADNPNASVLSTINVGLAGVFLAIGLITTGELAIPIGVHVTWNFFQGNVFGFPVSGTDAGTRLFAIEQGGEPWITGGEFGPEAGVIGLVAMVVGTGAILGWLRVTRGAVRLHRALAEYRSEPD